MNQLLHKEDVHIIARVRAEGRVERAGYLVCLLAGSPWGSHLTSLLPQRPV